MLKAVWRRGHCVLCRVKLELLLLVVVLLQVRRARVTGKLLHS